MSAERRAAAMGLVYPPALDLPGPARFSWVRVHNDLAWISGHIALTEEGVLMQPTGKVGVDVSLGQAVLAARQVAVTMLGSLQRHLGSLDAIRSWLRVHGMINVGPDFNQMPQVMNGFSGLIGDVFEARCADHSRSAVGVASLPFDAAVEVEGVVALDPAWSLPDRSKAMNQC